MSQPCHLSYPVIYPARERVRTGIARYIKFRYNAKCFHSRLGYRILKRGSRLVPELAGRSMS